MFASVKPGASKVLSYTLRFAVLISVGCGSGPRDFSPFKARDSSNQAVEDLESALKDAAAANNKPPETQAEISALLKWHESYDLAMQEAESKGRPVLALFTGSDWCHYCVKLKENVLDTATFKNWAVDRAVLLELDFPRNKDLPIALKSQNERLRNQYGVEGYPTVIVLDPAGQVRGKLGYMGNPQAWIQ